MKTRADALALLHEFTQTDALRKHALGVEEAMRAYARWFGVTELSGDRLEHIAFLIAALEPIAGEIGL